jgi:hypothetical protein
MPDRSPRSVSCRQKGVFGRLSLHQKFPFPPRGWFDDWVVGLQFEPYCLHHPVLANRRFPARRQTGRFCGDFQLPISGIFVSVGGQAVLRRFWTHCLCIPKFRSRRLVLSAKSEGGVRQDYRYCTIVGMLGQSGAAKKPFWIKSEHSISNCCSTQRADREAVRSRRRGWFPRRPSPTASHCCSS